MSNRGLDMLQVKQIIRLHCEGKGYREISDILGNTRKAVTKYVLLFRSTGLRYEEIKDYGEPEIYAMMSAQEKPGTNRLEVLESRLPEIEHELKSPGVTKQYLWQEYKVSHPDGYNYTQFCLYYKKWLKASEATMHFEHKAGDKMYVDFTGNKLKTTDKSTGEVHEVEVFVAILGASQLTYVEAVASQKKEDFIAVVENALHYFNGVPVAIVPDNLKSAVTKASKYEPELNHTFAGFGLHYGTTILPARSRKPRDKSLVEGAVKIVYTRIFAPLRKRIFFTIQELNEAIREELEKHNNTKFQGKEYSRSELFNQIEREVLNQLPAKRYEIKDIAVATVYKSSFIWLPCDKHYYSVPYRYIGKKVKIEYSRSSVEIYYEHERIAFHNREYGQYRYTTISEHLPSTHRFISDWSPEKFLSWASAVGEETEKVISKILETKAHPEQAYKSCVGILSYGKKVGYQRLNQACRRADEFGSYSYRTVKNILTNNYDSLSKEEQNQYQSPKHENIRGSEYYDLYN
jgi:transposase